MRTGIKENVQPRREDGAGCPTSNAQLRKDSRAGCRSGSDRTGSRRYDKEFERVRWRSRRASTRDESVAGNGKAKQERVDLGLALLSRVAIPGVSYTYDEIASWAGCTESAIYLIERRALVKLRNRLRFLDPALGRQLFTELFERRTAAVSRNRAEIS